MLSLSSAKAGSRAASGNSGCVVLGVVCEARRLVREGGRRGVVGREGRRVREVLRGRVLLEGGLSAGVVVAIVCLCVLVVLEEDDWETRCIYAGLSRVFVSPASPAQACHHARMRVKRVKEGTGSWRMNALSSWLGY